MHPFYGGEAVYWARAILRLDINDELPALRKSHANQQTSAPNEIVQTEKLVPNPATDVVTLNSNEPFGDNELITVFNFLQQKIIEYKLPDKQKQFVFDTTNLLQGIYFIKHTNGGKIISEDKLVIIK
jgi:hypothetical protein